MAFFDLDLIIGIFLGTIGHALISLGLVLQKKALGRMEVKRDIEYNERLKKNEEEFGLGGMDQNDSNIDKKPRIKFVKDLRWLGGFSVMIAGNVTVIGALTFATQTLVSGLTVMILVFNVIFAPLLLKEKVTLRDLVSTFGITLAVVGIVFFSPRADSEFEKRDLLTFFLETPFLIFLISIASICILLIFYVSIAPSVWNGKERDLDTGLGRLTAYSTAFIPGILGAFKLLFSKIVGEMCQATFQGRNQFFFGTTYLCIALLGVTNISQVYTLQRALASFSALVIIPCFQVSLTLCSAVTGGLYFQGHSTFPICPTHLFPEFAAYKGQIYQPILFAVSMGCAVIGVIILSRREAQGMERFEKRASKVHESDTSDIEGTSVQARDSSNPEPLPPNKVFVVSLGMDYFPITVNRDRRYSSFMIEREKITQNPKESPLDYSGTIVNASQESKNSSSGSE